MTSETVPSLTTVADLHSQVTDDSAETINSDSITTPVEPPVRSGIYFCTQIRHDTIRWKRLTWTKKAACGYSRGQIFRDAVLKRDVLYNFGFKSIARAHVYATICKLNRPTIVLEGLIFIAILFIIAYFLLFVT